MGYTHRDVNSLHGDEPEIDALANRAEAMRDVDAEIDRRQAMMPPDDLSAWVNKMNAEEAKRRTIVQLRWNATQMAESICNLIRMTDVPNGVASWSADNIAKQAERLQQLCREMAK